MAIKYLISSVLLIPQVIYRTGGTMGYNFCFFLNLICTPAYRKSLQFWGYRAYFGDEKPSAEGKWACCLIFGMWVYNQGNKHGHKIPDQ
jgi:hypothetical protein